MSDDILALIQRFISGDADIKLANQIEIAIDDRYPNDAFLQETVEMLAMYRPEGGEFLFDTEMMKARLIETRTYLTRH